MADAIVQMDYVGALNKRLVSIVRLLSHAKLTRGCGRVTVRKTLPVIAKLSYGAGTFTGDKLRVAEHEQGQQPSLPIGPSRPRHHADAPTAVPRASSASTATRIRDSSVFAAGPTDPLEVFFRTNPTNLPPPEGLAPLGDPMDPSVAQARNVVLITGNTYLAVSIDGGKSFIYKDPRTIFTDAQGKLDNPDPGPCCDQVLQYDPRTDRFYWLLQWDCTGGCYTNPKAENRYRLAVASPADVARWAVIDGPAWKYFDFTSQTFGVNGRWMDFPDMAVGDQHLYLTFDVIGGSVGAIWARVSTVDLRDRPVGSSFTPDVVPFQGPGLYKPVQNAGAVGWVIHHVNDSVLEAIRWRPDSPQSDDPYFVLHDSYTHDAASCVAGTPVTPGRRSVDWLSTTDGGKGPCGGMSQWVSGAAMDGGGKIWVAWTAGRDKDVPAPHIQLAMFEPSKSLGAAPFPQYGVVQNVVVAENRSIWFQGGVAAGYPALTGGPSGEIALTFIFGGSSQQLALGVGLLSNRQDFAKIAEGNGHTGRMGDYYTVRPVGGYPGAFAVGGYVLDPNGASDTATKYAPKYAVFGRSATAPPVASSVALDNPVALAASVDGKTVYAVSNGGRRLLGVSAVAQFNRDASTGHLTYRGCLSQTGVGHCAPVSSVAAMSSLASVAVSSDGKTVYTVASGGNSIAQFNRDANTGDLIYRGCLSDVAHAAAASGGPCQAVPGTTALNSPVAVAVSLDGKTVYTVASGGNAIAQFNRNTANGDLVYRGCLSDADHASSGPCQPVPGTTALNDPVALAVSADGKTVYTVAEGANAITQFNRDTNTGDLVYRGCLSDAAHAGSGPCQAVPATTGLPGTNALNSPVSVAVSFPAPTTVYTAASGGDAIAQFNRDANTGDLSYRGCLSDAGPPGCDAAVNPANALNTPASVAAFNVPVETVYSVAAGFQGPLSSGLSSVGDAIAQFNRNANTPDLVAYQRCLGAGGCTPVNSTSALNRPVGVAVSYDGNNVYTVAAGGDAIAEFHRDTIPNMLFPGDVPPLRIGTLSYLGCISATGAGSCESTIP